MTPITLPEYTEQTSDSAQIVDDLPVDDALEVHNETDPPDELDPVEEAQEDPLEGIEFIEPEVSLEKGHEAEAEGAPPLMDLETAVERIPEPLRKEMAELLRAEFREVIRWKAGKTRT